MSDLKKNPYEAVGLETWRRGAWLGVLLVGLFIVGAVVTFPLLILLGLNFGNSLILAAILGPIVGTGGFIGWWLWRSPYLIPPKVDD